MNAIAPIQAQDRQVDSGPACWPYRFTFDDVLKMQEVGILDPDVHVELLDGELIEMPEEGGLHVWIKNRIGQYLTRLLPTTYSVMIDSTLKFNDHHAPDPDVYILKDVQTFAEIRPADVPLIMEVADSSLSLDLGRKALRYAQYGMADYWVIDVGAAVTHVLRDPGQNGYRAVSRLKFDQPLTALAIPELTLVLADLPGMNDFGR